MPAPATDVLRNVSCFVDGRGYAGNLEMVTPPKLTAKTEEFRAGGMDMPIEIDQGLEVMECSCTTTSIDPELLKQWGLAHGALIPMTLRGALQAEDGTVRAVVITVRGRVKEIDFGDWKPGEKSSTKFTISPRYYKLELAGETIHEVDAENMIRIIDGTDQLAAQRQALGI